MGVWHERAPPHGQYLGRGPGLVGAGAEDAALAAEDACRASLPACGSHRWAGAGAELQNLMLSFNLLYQTKAEAS